MDAKRKMGLAVLLGVVWVGLVLWQLDSFKEPTHVPLTNVSGVRASSQPGKNKPVSLQVNLDLLDAARTQREATFTAPRNIFAVPHADGTLSIGPEGGTAGGPGEGVTPVSAQALAQQESLLEMGQYRYLGYMRVGNGRKRDVAVLSKNEEVVVVKVGDHVEDRLILKAITPENVTIRDVETRIDQSLPLADSPAVEQ